MTKLLPLLAALALAGCADEAADVDVVAEPPAEVVTEPADDVVVPEPLDAPPIDDPTIDDPTMDDGMTEGEMGVDTTATM